MAITPSSNKEELAQSIDTAPRGDTLQHVSFTDLICEGPIEGLAEGLSSIYLNDIPVYPYNLSNWAHPGQLEFTAADSTLGTASDGVIWRSELAIAAGANTDRTLSLIPEKQYANLEVTSVSLSSAGDGYDISFTPSIDSDYLAGTGSTYMEAFMSVNGVSMLGEIRSTSKFFISKQSLLLRPEVGDDFYINVNKSYPIYELSPSDGLVRTTVAPPAGQYNFVFNGEWASPASNTSEDFGGLNKYAPELQKIDQIYFQGRSGTVDQMPIVDVGGVGAGVSSIEGYGEELYQVTSDSDTGADCINPEKSEVDQDGNVDYSQHRNTPVRIGSTYFGLTTASLRSQVDKIGFKIVYPSGLVNVDQEKAKKTTAYAFYDVRIALKRNGAWTYTGDIDSTDWENQQQVWRPYLKHSGKILNAPISFDHIIDLSRFRPFEDFQILIHRVTRHNGLYVEADGSTTVTDRDRFKFYGGSRFAQPSYIIEDHFSYPYSVLANVSFSSKEFSQTPKRTYDIRGLKVKIPTSYTTREQSDNKVAQYSGFWNGGFKQELEYTDNPAWVFYDLCTNNRYGAGKFINESDIDKYALYRIARYCDELIDTGYTTRPDELIIGEIYEITAVGNTDWDDITGASVGSYSVGDRILCKFPGTGDGTATRLEPRFRMNLFLTKEEQLYKVLKDMASAFTSMLYWMDNKVTLIQDAPAQPIANFSKSNVIDGMFTYETSSNRIVPNQMLVSWNDPDSNYQPQLVVVEDQKDIARRNKIVSDRAIAFGCTSETQAIRYGRWKLWTAQNQNEVVAFKTALEGAHIRPGDIINIQDADRYGASQSGRISSVGSPSGGLQPINLDRDVEFSSAHSYELNIVHTGPRAIYIGVDPITVNGTTYSKGDWLPQAYVNGTLVNLDTEERASNAFPTSTSTQLISTVWKKDTWVMTYPIEHPGDTSTNVVEIDYTAQSILGTITPGTVWALKEWKIAGVNDIVGTSKQYKVLSVTQDEKHIHSIAAVEHYNEKYDAVDERYELGSTVKSLYPDKEPYDIPPPLNLKVKEDNDSEEVIFTWDAPNDINFVAKYQIQTNLTDYRIFETSNQYYIIGNNTNIKVYFYVRTVSPKGNYSAWKTITYVPSQPPAKEVERIHGLIKGATTEWTGVFATETCSDSGSNTQHDQDTVFKFEKYPNTVTANGAKTPFTYTQYDWVDTNDNTRMIGHTHIDEAVANPEKEWYIVHTPSYRGMFLGQWNTTFFENDCDFWSYKTFDTADWILQGTGYINKDDDVIHMSASVYDVEPGDVILIKGPSRDVDQGAEGALSSYLRSRTTGKDFVYGQGSSIFDGTKYFLDKPDTYTVDDLYDDLFDIQWIVDNTSPTLNDMSLTQFKTAINTIKSLFTTENSFTVDDAEDSTRYGLYRNPDAISIGYWALFYFTNVSGHPTYTKYSDQEFYTFFFNEASKYMLHLGAICKEDLGGGNIRIDRTFGVDIPTTAIHRYFYRPDYDNDCVLASVKVTGS